MEGYGLNGGKHQPEQRRFSQEQYDMLKRCSEKRDMTEWNKWREEHMEYYVQDVLLEGGDFTNWHLEGVNLGTSPQYGRRTPEVFLSKANFDNARLEGASFQFSHVEGARFHEAHLEHANLMFAHLNDKVFLLGVHLEYACLQCAELRNANVCNAHLDKANFIDAELQGSKFDNAFLIGTKFQKARVDGSTSFCYCKVDRETDFREVGIDSVQIDPATRQLLECNIRRKNWEEWYPKHSLLKWPVHLFWCFSDYGISTWRIIGWFFGLALVFAAIYYLWGLISPPGIIDFLFVDGNGVKIAGLLVPVRAVHFSVVIMTVGFTNMHANAHSFWAHILVGSQMILGFVLLGALVTRFAVLFTAGGPAGKFADKQSISDRLSRLWTRIKGKDAKRP
jgi:uncharacterized protein YjbI with pentapeptide repeats